MRSTTLVGLALLGLALVGCDGEVGAPDASVDGSVVDSGPGRDAGFCLPGLECGPCARYGDCSHLGSGWLCYPPGQRAPGGVAPPPPDRQCESSATCPGQVCADYPTPGNEGYPSWRCQDACTVDSCETSLRCASSGLCEPTPCDEGFACPVHTTCDPDAEGHGCVRHSCTVDTDCVEDGHCVEGACYTTLGTCQAFGA